MFGQMSSGRWLRRRALLTLAFSAAACGYPKLPELGGDAGTGDAGSRDSGSGADAAIVDASSEKALTSLVFRAADNPLLLGSDVTATFDGMTVTAKVPLGANESLVASFTTTGASVEVNGVAQQSGVTANDFFAPLTYRVVAGDGSTADYTVTVTAPQAQQAYVKSSNTEANDNFGFSVALSKDGSTLAVGAKFEASAATGINGNQFDDSASNAGAVYLFTRSGGLWHQQAYIKASNTGSNDEFGYSVSLSDDGNTLAVGAMGEASAATGINGNGADNTASFSGAAYVFTRSGTTWSQQAYVKASNTGANDEFGFSIALSGDGNTLGVGARQEASAATGINGNGSDNSVTDAGAAYVFTRSGTTWSQQAYVKGASTGAYDQLGSSLSLSSDGSLLVVGALGAGGGGTAYVYKRSGTSWSQQAAVVASNPDSGDYFGTSVSLSRDGSTLAVGANFEASLSPGINGDQSDNSGPGAGAVYVFAWSGTSWAQQAYVKASNPDANIDNDTADEFGTSVSVANDGNTLVVGAPGEQSSATGIDGNQADNSFFAAGAAYVFTRSGTSWRQEAYVKASNTGNSDHFGAAIALSGDGTTLAAGAAAEASNAQGINGNQSDNSAANAGAAYVFQ